ncbi:GNAT family N-acetyltransferase [Winogradskyella ouciana]|uniref:GNAT family N-acetyltransferase n=1 Tax=Winogradskyella ouciana TaxID=2608631 RepID=A0A7K1G8X7_9FLAO|nr:GNAT family N-acetyltransferase [Winogradskyella ouciana]MTE25485.1 GNAT family N-acetyltransferase [Winogradskyella ouciana]
MTSENSFYTQRLHIRPVTTEDAPFILELMNTPKWIQFIGDRKVRTIEEAENYIIEKVLVQFNKHSYSNNVILRKDDNVKLGTCGIYHREDREDPDIGFAFLPQYEGKGYAYEAANKLMHVAQQNYGLTELSGYTLEENAASRKLLERLGFSLKGLGNLPNSDDELLHYHRVLDF